MIYCNVIYEQFARMAKSNYPPVGFYFKVHFGSAKFNSETSFKEVSGLSVSMTPEDITEGGQLGYKHRLPTVAQYSNLVLKRGLVTDSKLRDWIEKGINDFTFTPLTINISLLNENAKPLMSWVVYKAYPVKWEVSSFNSMSNELVVETMELAFSYFKTKT